MRVLTRASHRMERAMDDRQAMRRAMAPAAAVRGPPSPTPGVGAVLETTDGHVHHGATAPPGGPHAEVAALAAKRRGWYERGEELYLDRHELTLALLAGEWGIGAHGFRPRFTRSVLPAGVTFQCRAGADESATFDAELGLQPGLKGRRCHRCRHPTVAPMRPQAVHWQGRLRAPSDAPAEFL